MKGIAPIDVAVSTEHRFDRTPDGAIWTQTMFGYPFWSRYRSVFHRVHVIARVRDVSVVPEEWQRADGCDVSFTALPHYLGPTQYLRRLPEIRQVLRTAVGPHDAVIMRVPSEIASQLIPILAHTGHPYGLEVLGDPYDVFAPGAVRHPLRPFLRWRVSHQLREQCQRAAALSYVTERALQLRYPPGRDAYATHYSDVDLAAIPYVEQSRPKHSVAGPITLVTVGSLAQLYKAPDTQIDAIALLAKQGFDLNLVIVGDGKHRAELEKRAAAQDVADRVHFRGQITAGVAVCRELDAADLYIMPSRTEGMPRAMVEAMARALPCIGSTMGGIPELLTSEDMVPPDDAGALADKIRQVVGSPERMERMSARNLRRAYDYSEDILCERRTRFYLSLRETTEAWAWRTVAHPTKNRSNALPRNVQL